MNCELCGKEAETKDVLIEGIDMSVCPVCAKHGKELKKPVFNQRIRKRQEEPEKTIVSDYAKLIKQKRESLGMKQEEFAKIVSEKVSTMNSIEAGSLKPTFKLAERLKKKFGLKLIEEVKNTKVVLETSSSEGLTIGDLIKKS